MKLKEFGPPGGGARPKFYYVDPPLQSRTKSNFKIIRSVSFRSPLVSCRSLSLLQLLSLKSFKTNYHFMWRYTLDMSSREHYYPFVSSHFFLVFHRRYITFWVAENFCYHLRKTFEVFRISNLARSVRSNRYKTYSSISINTLQK